MSTPVSRGRTVLRSPLTIAAVLVAIIIVALILTRPPTYVLDSAADPQNPDPIGAMAVAEVLRDHGVSITVVRSVSSALAAENEALVITAPNRLNDEQLEALSGLSRDTVLLDVRAAVPGFLPDLQTHSTQSEVTEASCADARAQAGPIDTSSRQFSAPGAEVCFPGGSNGTPAGAMLTVRHANGSLVTVLPVDVVKNDNLLHESNAALALRTLGEHSSITWLVADRHDPYPTVAPAAALGLGWLYAPLVALFLAIAWWRAPRFGQLLAEPLPVTVHASETTIGRGRLYQAANALGHAATSLRLGAFERMAPRIGLPPHAGRNEAITAVAVASSRSEAEIAELLYGPAPISTQSLHALALSLDALVDEVEHS